MGSKSCMGAFGQTIVTIGNFDGIHLGHQEILKLMNKEKDRMSIQTLLYTFEPHPVKVLFPGKELFIITPFDEKMEILENFGLDNVVCEFFSAEFSKTEPEDFVKNILCGILRVKKLFVGPNFRFGFRARGDISLLKTLSSAYQFEVELVDPVILNGKMVSSSLIRSLLRAGRVREASCLLGRDFFVKTKVIKGSGLGRRIGIPTANCEVRGDMLLKDGVYAVRVEIKGTLHPGVLSFGAKPTFGVDERSMEVHIMDFNDDIYGETLRVYFIERLRDIVSFRSADELKGEILRDIERARSIMQNLS